MAIFALGNVVRPDDDGGGRVRPGDLITADLVNGILDALDGIERKLDGSDLIRVESFLGRPLNDALFRLRELQLRSGTVIDTDGQIIGIGDTTSKQRIVLAQMPSPDDRVQANREVFLTVSVPPKATESTPQITSVAPQRIALDEGRPATIAISGKNFSETAIVKIDGAQVTSQFANGVITADFPRTLPGGEPGSRQSRLVPIAVEMTSGRAIDQIEVIGRTVIGKPVITAVKPRTKQIIMIAGRNFGDQPRVLFDGDAVRVLRSSDTSIEVDAAGDFRRFLDQIDDRTFKTIFKPEEDPRVLGGGNINEGPDFEERAPISLGVATRRTSPSFGAAAREREVDPNLFRAGAGGSVTARPKTGRDIDTVIVDPGAVGDKDISFIKDKDIVKVVERDRADPIKTVPVDRGSVIEVVVEANGMQSEPFTISLLR